MSLENKEILVKSQNDMGTQRGIQSRPEEINSRYWRSKNTQK